MRIGIAIDILRRGATPALTYVNTETQTLVAAMTVAPTQQRVNLIDAWFTAVKAASINAALMPFWVMPAAHTQQAGNLNWMVPANTPMANGGATVPVWTQDVGYTFDQTTYIDSNFNPTTASIALNSECLLGYNLMESAANTNLLGTQNSFFVPRRSTGNQVSGASQTATSTTGVAGTMTTAIGLTAFNRALAANTVVYKNGAVYETLVRVSASVSNHNLYLGGRNSGTNTLSGGGIYIIPAAGYASSLTTAQILALYNATRTYLLALGNSGA